MRALRRVLLTVAVVIALVCSLIQATSSAAALAQPGGLPGPVVSKPLPPGQVTGKRQPPSQAATQAPAPAGGPLHDAQERFKAAVAERRKPQPVAPDHPSTHHQATDQQVHPVAAGVTAPARTTEPLATSADTTAVSYGATYQILASPDPAPRYDTPGYQRVRVTNTSNVTWSASSTYLGYHLHYANGNVYNLNGIGTELTSDLPPGYYVDIDGMFEQLPAGSFLLNWDVRVGTGGGGTSFLSSFGVVASQAVAITVPHYAPTGSIFGPANNSTVDNLSPYLTVDVSADNTQPNWVEYKVCPTADTTDPACWDPGWRSVTMGGFYGTTSIQPPAGVLKWNTTFYWQARVKDNTYTTPWSDLTAFSPVVTPGANTHLGPGQADPVGVDLYQGNYSRTETDVQLPIDGTTLTIARTYNSASSSIGAFGRGWSSVLDMRQDVDSAGFLTVSYPDGRQIRYGQNPDGSWVPAYGQPDEAVYAGRGSVTMPDGTVYLFNSDGTLGSINAPGGQSTYLRYSGGKLTGIDLGAVRHLYVTWGTSHLAAISTVGGTPPVRQAGVQTWTYGYTLDQLTSACNPRWDVTACTTYRYGSDQRLNLLTPPNGAGEAVSIGYDSGTGRVSQVGYPDPAVTGGDVWRYAKSDPIDTNADYVVAVTQPSGLVMRYQYGGWGQLLNRWSSTPTPQNWDNQVWTYDVFGRVAGVMDENQNLTTYYYDGWNHLTTIGRYRDPQTLVNTSYLYFTGDSGQAYNPADPRSGKVLQTSDADHHLTTMAYNSFGQLTSRTTPGTAAAPNGATTTYQYTCDSGSGRNPTLAPVVVNDPANAGALQACGLLASVTGPDGQVTGYGYDAYGEQTRITTATGEVTDQFYDGFGHLTRKLVTEPDGTPASETDYVYDGAGHLVGEADPAVVNPVTGVTHQKKTSSSYDKDGNLLTSTVSDATATTAGGDPARTTVYGYDVRGRQNSVTVNGVRTASKSYDGDGNLVTSTDGIGTTFQYTYEQYHGWLLDIAIPAFADNPAAPTTTRRVDVASYSYDPAGRLASATDAMGARVLYTYTADNLKLSETFDSYLDTPTSTPRQLVLHQYTYDPAGNVLSDLAGGTRTTSYAYDNTNALLSSTVDPSGLNRTASSSYDVAGRLLSSTLSNSTRTETSSQQYDPVGRLVRAVVHNDATADLVTAYTRDARGQVLTVTDPRGTATATPDPAYTTTNAYDALGRLSTVTEPKLSVEDGSGAGAVTATPATTRGYDTFGELTDVKDPRGNVTHTTYDGFGRRAQTTYPTSTEPNGTQVTPHESWTYDANGNVLSHTDKLGQRTDLGYDGRNRPIRLTAPAAVAGGTRGTTTYAWNDGGKLLSEIDPTGAQTLHTYDQMGRVSSTTTVERYLPGAATTPAQYTTSYLYDPFGDLLSQMSGGSGVSYGYDAVGEKVTETVLGRSTTGFGYDVAGRLVRTTDALGRHRDTSYDLAGRRIRQTSYDPNNTAVTTAAWTNDAAGNPTAITDPDGKVWQASYDAASQVARLTDPVPTDANGTVLPAPSTSFGYDANGNRTRVTDGDSNATLTAYNAWNQPSVTVEPATTAHPALADRTWTTSYNALGEPVAMTAPGGVTSAAGYDLLGELTSQSGTGAEASTFIRQFGYDLDGRMTSVDAPYGAENFVYNDRGELYAYSHPSFTGDGDVSYVNQYDALGRLTVRSGAAGSTAFGYDTAGAVTSVTDPLSGGTRSYTYDPVGQLTAEKDTASGGAVAASYSFGYDGIGRPLSETRYDASGAQTGTLGYSWDPNGNLTATTGSGALAGQHNRTYRYDADNRLISAVDQGQNTETDYAWDGAGNRSSSTSWQLVGATKSNPAVTTASYDQRNRLTGTSSQQQTASYQWTARGTLASTTTTALPEGSPLTVSTASDAFDQLIKDGSATNSYDALGRLVSGNNQTIEYDGLGDEPVSDGSWLYARDLTGRPLAARPTSGSASSLLTNVHGDVIGAADPGNGSSRGTQTFGPFGEPQGRGAGLSPLGFQGGWTAASGRVDARARWYDPSLGGFLAGDSLPGPISSAASDNLYGYGAGNPTSNVDPTGHLVEDPFSWAEGGLKEAASLLRGGINLLGKGAVEVENALPEVADAIVPAIEDVAVDAAAGVACVVGCLEALVIGAIVVVVVAGIYYALKVNEDGSLSNEGPTTNPGAGVGPGGQLNPVRSPNPQPGPPQSPQPQTVTRTTVNSWTTHSSWYDDKYLYTRTDTFVRTVTTTLVGGVQVGAPVVSIAHTWTLVWQLLVPLDNPIPTPVPKPGPPQQPENDQGNADPRGKCGDGGTPATCLTGNSPPGPQTQPQGGKGGNGGKYTPPTNKGSCDDDPGQDGTIAGDPLSTFADAVRGAAGQKGVQYASEYTSPSGATYYCTNQRFMNFPQELKDIFDRAGLAPRGCAEMACLVEAYRAEGEAGVRGGAMRTVKVFGESAKLAAEHGTVGTPCPLCQDVLRYLDISF
ncbi:DUF6531 domain-containing protein [Kitasatospora sp. NPDC006697]|uniref:DUF6531 domain-containing protein n=1 Tax=Kitasatospora sp. NPDC006697 TaxID=3364020 RepID=UPI0036A83BB4